MVRERLAETLRLQADEISRFEQSLELLRKQRRATEESTRCLLEAIEENVADNGRVLTPSVQSVCSSVHNLAKATHAEHVFEVLAAEAAQMNLRTVVFDVRGKAAWAFSAGGFGSRLTNQNLHSLVVPLNRENPFRQVFETAEALETNAEGLGKNHNVLEKLNPAPTAHIWLLPIRSAESVTAIFYSECGESENSILANALKLLTEFAGAQLDRLIALSGGFVGEESVLREEHLGPQRPAGVRPPESKTLGREVDLRPGSSEVAISEPSLEVAATEPVGNASVTPASLEAQEVPPAEETEMGASKAPDVVPPSEEDLKLHRDAQRFSRLLVSEIELYNKEEVKEGRKNKDLYQRLKRDIDRSRQTYEKRFGNSVVTQFDYFHEELVRALAGNDPSLLGSDYPGPSV